MTAGKPRDRTFQALNGYLGVASRCLARCARASGILLVAAAVVYVSPWVLFADEVIATVDLGPDTDPLYIAITPNGMHAYVSTRYDGVYRIDLATLTVGTPIGGLGQVYGMAISPDGDLLYAADRSTQCLWLIATASNSVVDSVPCAEPGQGNIAVSPDGHYVYVPCYAGIRVISVVTRTEVDLIPAGDYLGGIAITPDGKRLCIAEWFASNLAIYDIESGAIVRVSAADACPAGVAVAVDGQEADVACNGNWPFPNGYTVDIISVLDGSRVTAHGIGGHPAQIAMTPDGRYAYVTIQDDNAVRVIDTQTHARCWERGAAVGVGPWGIAITPDGSRACVANCQDGTVSVISIAAGAQPTAVADFTASDGEDAKCTLTWTNPLDSDLGEVVVCRKIIGYPVGHEDGVQVFQDPSPILGEAISYEDSSLMNGTTYYYAAFVKNALGNWNDEFEVGRNADSGTPNLPDSIDLFVLPGSVQVTRGDPSLEPHSGLPRANQLCVLATVGNAGQKGANEATVTLTLCSNGESIAAPKTLDLPAGSHQQISFEWDLAKNVTSPTAVCVRIEALDAVEPAGSTGDNWSSSEAVTYLYLGGGGAGRQPFDLARDAYGFDNFRILPGEKDLLTEILQSDFHLASACNLGSMYSELVGLELAGAAIGALGGHCYGMAATSLVYWESPALKPVLPGDVYDYSALDIEAKDAINRFHVYQFEHLEVRAGPPSTAADFSDTVRSCLSSDKGCVVCLVGSGKGHAAAAYGMLEQGETAFVYVYDPNYNYGSSLLQRWASFIVVGGLDGIRGLCYPEFQPYATIYKGVTAFAYAETAFLYDEYSEFRAWEPVRDTITDLLTPGGTLCQFLSQSVWKPLSSELDQWWGRVTIGSPIEVVITDSIGRQTGLHSGVEINDIPGAEIVDGLSAVSYYIPRDTSGVLCFEATRDGLAHLALYTRYGSALRIDYFEFPVSQEDCGCMDLSRDRTTLILSIDERCNGTTDRIASPAVLFPLGGGALARGDLDGDGRVDVVDVRLCLEFATGCAPCTMEQRAAADIDNDGDVDIIDARILAEYVLGLRSTLP